MSNAIVPWEEQVVDDWLRALDCSEDTRRTYRTGMRRFYDWLRDQGRPIVTPGVIRGYRDSIPGSPATVNVRLSAVRSFYAWLAETGMGGVNPASTVKGIKRRGRAHRRDELTADEVLAVLEACTRPRDAAIVALMAYCALRTVEVHRANLEDLQTRDGRLVLMVHGKGHQEASEFVVIPAPAEIYLRRWLQARPRISSPALFIPMAPSSKGDRLSRSAIRSMVKDRYRDAGVIGDRKTTHSLRHSAISTAIRNGATPQQAQAMARHSSVDTTLRYYHSLDRLARPAEDLITYGVQQHDMENSTVDHQGDASTGWRPDRDPDPER